MSQTTAQEYKEKLEKELPASLVIPPGARARLIINESFIVEFVKPMPGRWHRLWYRLLLGWRWEEI